jgi:hypothetical protein
MRVESGVNEKVDWQTQLICFMSTANTDDVTRLETMNTLKQEPRGATGVRATVASPGT